MKFNLEIDIDWIDEDNTIDDVVKQQIISSIIRQTNEKVESHVLNEVNKMLDGKIVAKVDELVTETFNEFMKKEVNLTDSYGSVIKTHESVYAVIKDRFDTFLTQKVDANGKTKTDSYGASFTRLTYIIDEQLRNYAEKFTTEAEQKVSAEIKEHVKDGLTKKLGSELMKVLKVNDMLKIEG